MNKFLSFLIVLPLISCSANTPNNVLDKKIETNQVIVKPQVSEERLIIAQVSDKVGASFMTKLNLNSFSSKANVNGTPAKQPSDVSTVDVYLLSLPSGFTGTDPLGTANANVVRTFTNLAKTGSSFNILFKNVPGLATNQYYVGIVAKDSGNNIISKLNTTWTGQTATSASSMSLSTTGVGVDATTLAVSSTSDLIVNMGLLDAVGAQISTNANVSGGTTTLPIITAQ